MLDLATTTKAFVTVDEVAEYLHRSKRTIYYWIHHGKIDSTHTPLGQRIPIAELQRLAQYLQDHTLLQIAHPAVDRVRALSAQSSATID